jgi:hypothetical protein
MKIVKMSLVAAMLMGASAFAVENTKVSGSAQLVYQTQDAAMGALNSGGSDMFDKDASSADAALHLNVSADLTPGISAGATYTAISTLGLENNFVGSVWAGSHAPTTSTGASFPVGAEGALGAPGIKVENASWFEEAWLAGTYGKTTAKIGRMQLDTPLAYSETWSVETNTFEAAAVINQDIPDTTVVLAYVGNGNGNETFGQDKSGTFRSVGHATGAIVNENGAFTTYGTDGAYAAGIINNSLEMLTLQAWYYDVSKLAYAYWLQADVNVAGIMAGLQYSGITIQEGALGGAVAKDIDSDVFAGVLGYEMKDLFTAKVSMSQVGEDHSAGFNTATSTGASKLYTEAWWNYGYVSRADTSAFNITVTSPVQGIVDLGLFYTASTTKGQNGAKDLDMSEFTLTAGKSFGPLDATLAYIMTDADDQNLNANGESESYNIVQAYLTYNF